ncbi:MAG: hypothetical protein A3F89_08145 [Deltaproteobacteria bacterium RIFCSPLOWO2_12_FULL_50_11]|nr:MAG: hypothetical protein A3F89_08145 [Deltaproteobacteria bacterium RIFCSPLOWO2_12_FULL_50_11]
MMRKRVKFLILGVVILVGLPFSWVGAMTIVQLNLLQLTEMAPIIFRGYCISVDRKIQGGRDVLVVSFKVDEVIKGSVGSTVTFNQLAPPDKDLREIGLGSAFEGMPTYSVGEECVVFLSEESSLGLAAPIGLGQGRFCVREDGSGQKFIANDINNAGLFRDLSNSPVLKAKTLSSQQSSMVHKAPQQIRYGDFVPLVKQLMP